MPLTPSVFFTRYLPRLLRFSGNIPDQTTILDDVLQYKYVKWPGVHNGRAMRNGIYEERARGMER